MNEKKTIYFKLSTIIYLLAILILVIALCILSYKLYFKNDTNTNNLNNISSPNNIVSNNTSFDINISTNTTSTSLEPDNIDKIAISKYTDYLTKYYMVSYAPIELLEDLGLYKQDFSPFKYEKDSKGNPTQYIITNVKFSDFREKMLSIMSENLFKENFLKENFVAYKNVNGYVYVIDGGATGVSFKLSDLKLESKKDNIYNYTAKITYYNVDESIQDVAKAKFSLIKVNNYYVINSSDIK